MVLQAVKWLLRAVVATILSILLADASGVKGIGWLAIALGTYMFLLIACLLSDYGVHRGWWGGYF